MRRAARSSQSALRLPNHRGEWASRLPTQLFEGASAIVLLVVAIVVWPHLPFSGALFLVVVAGYGATRLVLESTRESSALSRGLTIDRAISGSLAAVALSLLAARWVM
jgi:prolipoprotein diacylglyceryltransferase